MAALWCADLKPSWPNFFFKTDNKTLSSMDMAGWGAEVDAACFFFLETVSVSDSSEAEGEMSWTFLGWRDDNFFELIFGNFFHTFLRIRMLFSILNYINKFWVFPDTKELTYILFWHFSISFACFEFNQWYLLMYRSAKFKAILSKISNIF